MDFLYWMDSLVATYGYFGLFLISIFGSLSIFFSVPYTLTLYAFGGRLEPILLGFVCGLGSAVDEFSAYMIGGGGRQLLEHRYGKRLDSAKSLIQRYGAFGIFLFVATPLPDDMLFMILGLVKFDLKTAPLACFLGKWLMCTTIAYAGKFSYEFVLDLLLGNGFLGIAMGFIILALIIVAMLKIDWTRFLPSK